MELKKTQLQASEDVSDISELNTKKGVNQKMQEDDETYFNRTIAKIDEIKKKLRTAKQDGMDVKMRQKLRNQVSAQQSRIKKKQEVLYLKTLLDKDNDKVCGILDILDSHLEKHPALLSKIKDQIQATYGDVERSNIDIWYWSGPIIILKPYVIFELTFV